MFLSVLLFDALLMCVSTDRSPSRCPLRGGRCGGASNNNGNGGYATHGQRVLANHCGTTAALVSGGWCRVSDGVVTRRRLRRRPVQSVPRIGLHAPADQRQTDGQTPGEHSLGVRDQMGRAGGRTGGAATVAAGMRRRRRRWRPGRRCTDTEPGGWCGGVRAAAANRWMDAGAA